MLLSQYCISISDAWVFLFCFFLLRKSAVLHISRRIPQRMRDRQRGACSIMFWAEKKQNRKPLVQTAGVLWVDLYVGIIRWYTKKAVFSLFRFSRCFWAQVEWAAHHGVHGVSLKSDSTPLPLWCENTCYSWLYESTTQPCFGDELLAFELEVRRILVVCLG